MDTEQAKESLRCLATAAMPVAVAGEEGDGAWQHSFAGTAQGGSRAAYPGLWRYSPSQRIALGVRADPWIDGRKTGEAMMPGEMFQVEATKVGHDGVVYLQLGGGRGWLFDRKPGVGTICFPCKAEQGEAVEGDTRNPAWPWTPVPPPPCGNSCDFSDDEVEYGTVEGPRDTTERVGLARRVLAVRGSCRGTAVRSASPEALGSGEPRANRLEREMSADSAAAAPGEASATRAFSWAGCPGAGSEAGRGPGPGRAAAPRGGCEELRGGAAARRAAEALHAAARHGRGSSAPAADAVATLSALLEASEAALAEELAGAQAAQARNMEGVARLEEGMAAAEASAARAAVAHHFEAELAYRAREALAAAEQRGIGLEEDLAAARKAEAEESLQLARLEQPTEPAAEPPANALGKSNSTLGEDPELEATLPEPYLRVVRQVEAEGWDGIQWGGNYTLLHWAAANSRAKLCERLVAQNADPHIKDDTGRSAFDYVQNDECNRALGHFAPPNARGILPSATASSSWHPAVLRQRTVEELHIEALERKLEECRATLEQEFQERRQEFNWARSRICDLEASAQTQERVASEELVDVERRCADEASESTRRVQQAAAQVGELERLLSFSRAQVAEAAQAAEAAAEAGGVTARELARVRGELEAARSSTREELACLRRELSVAQVTTERSEEACARERAEGSVLRGLSAEVEGQLRRESELSSRTLWASAEMASAFKGDRAVAAEAARRAEAALREEEQRARHLSSWASEELCVAREELRSARAETARSDTALAALRKEQRQAAAADRTTSARIADLECDLGAARLALAQLRSRETSLHLELSEKDKAFSALAARQASAALQASRQMEEEMQELQAVHWQVALADSARQGLELCAKEEATAHRAALREVEGLAEELATARRAEATQKLAELEAALASECSEVEALSVEFRAERKAAAAARAAEAADAAERRRLLTAPVPPAAQKADFGLAGVLAPQPAVPLLLASTSSAQVGSPSFGFASDPPPASSPAWLPVPAASVGGGGWRRARQRSQVHGGLEEGSRQLPVLQGNTATQTFHSFRWKEGIGSFRSLQTASAHIQGVKMVAAETPSQAEVDYADAGRKLLEAVNLGSCKAPPRYSPCDPLWRHPQTGATLFVGNAQMAASRKALQSHNITRIVNCQDSDGKNHFEGDPDLEYLRFPIGLWRDAPRVRDGGDGTWKYWEPLFSFVTEGLCHGQNVFVHCLAGAHRAGTAGVGLLMILCGWGVQDAIVAAKKLRPAIEPLGGFPELLACLQKARVGREQAIQILLPEKDTTAGVAGPPAGPVSTV